MAPGAYHSGPVCFRVREPSGGAGDKGDQEREGEVCGGAVHNNGGGENGEIYYVLAFLYELLSYPFFFFFFFSFLFYFFSLFLHLISLHLSSVLSFSIFIFIFYYHYQHPHHEMVR